MDNKPKCPLIGANSNIFNLMGIASRTLKDHGYKAEAEEMFKRITNGAESYTEALGIIQEYVEPVSEEETESEDYEI